MTSPMAARMLYLELTALLIGREIAKFERGEQVALVSFANIAKLAGNASQELTRSGMRAPMKARDVWLTAICHDTASTRSDDRVANNGQVPGF
jgi:hypothetical protein